MAFVVDLATVDRHRVADVGGKAANLGELTCVDGVEVPVGVVVTTAAFRRFAADVPSLDEHLDRLAELDPGDGAAIAAGCADIRALITSSPVPHEVVAALAEALDDLAGPYAVRSSATTEDAPTASFAGQYDTFLDVVGTASVLDHVRRCWASLFTDRAVAYRLRRGSARDTVAMAVVVQRMVAAEASGVLFTADPVTSNRTVSRVEAVRGLGEDLVAGRADAQAWTVRGGMVTSAPPAAEPVLTDAQAVDLAALGRRIEAHVGVPQDIEWCLAEGRFRIVQSRPITTLFPVPPVDDDAPHVYLSVGHQQMMTDAMTPLGLSFWQLTTPRPMAEAGSRLFVDVAATLSSPAARDGLLAAYGRGDPLVRDVLSTLIERGDLVPAPPAEPLPVPRGVVAPPLLDADPAVVDGLVEQTRSSLATLDHDIRRHQGPDLLAFVADDLAELRRVLFDPRGHQVYMTAMEASYWLDEHVTAWLGEDKVADVLTRSVPGNVTSEMGLALLDVADVIRPHPQAVAFLRGLGPEDDLDGLPAVDGGREAHEAIDGFLATYGARCTGEIDIGRPRWRERPAAIVPVLLGHVENAEPGEGRRRFAQGAREAAETEAEVLERLRELPDGHAKATETKTMIDRLRTFIGYREHPKAGMIARYALYREALLGEADRLVRDGVLETRDDVVLLRFEELRDVVGGRPLDPALIAERRAALARDRTLTPPRVLTSDGEAIDGAHRRDDVGDGVLVGLGVSRGSVEGRARVVRDMAEADLAPGDVLVTAFTDPSWSPAFVTIGGLVTEVGGAMTHGAVVAREYGLPAVVGLPGATRAIRDGQRIRVDGTSGHVELLDEGSARR